MSSRRPPATRRESKELTRQALVRAALKLLSRSSFDSISLREITREAGISPTAFYRHFDDTEELGLLLVEESFGQLREMLRTARSDPRLFDNAIRRSVETVVVHVRNHEGHMRFIARERHGGVRRIRRAIHRELQLFADELAIDMAVFPIIKDWSPEDRRMLAGLVVETMVTVSAELLDASPAEEHAIAERAVRQLRLIFTGVTLWNPKREAPPAGPTPAPPGEPPT